MSFHLSYTPTPTPEENKTREYTKLILSDQWRTGRVKEIISGFTSEKKKQKQKQEQDSSTSRCQKQQSHAYLANHDLPCQASLPCSLHSHQTPQKR